MRFNFTLKKAWLGVNKTLSAFLLLCFLGGTINAQTYVNSNLSTGATTSNGVAAPAGTAWSELQTGSTTFGVGASITNGIRLGDDFTVPAGNTWNLTSMTFYGYQTNYTGTTSPFTTIRVTIHSGSITGPVVFGDQTTNRFASSSDGLLFRIAQATPGTARKIWTINATTVVTLPEGTYWIEYATDVTGGVGHFLPVSTVIGTSTQPGNNAQQNTGTAWAPLLDGTNALDMPFSINYTAGPVVNCLGTPAPGNTLTTKASVCPGEGFTLSLQNPTPGAGVSYQWQSSPTSGGPFLPVTPAATGSTYTVSSITATTFYRAAVTCGGNTGVSNEVQVSLNPPSACYCASTATDPADEDILNVTFGTLNNTSTCATTAPGTGSVTRLYANYTGYTGAPTGNVFRGLPNALSVQIGTCGGNFANGTAVFIDYNQDGDFVDAGERVYGLGATTTGPHTETANVTVPLTATPGLTRMRVITVEFSAGTAINPCGTYTWGETEDYNITIVVPPACTGTPAPGNTISTQSSVCAGTTSFVLSLQNNPAVSGLTYQWFSGPSATGTFTPVAGATNSTLNVASITTATFYYAVVTCAGITGQSSTIGVGINPITQCYCASAASNVADEDIFRVTLGTLNNVSNCTSVGTGPGSILRRYANYQSGTGAPAAPNLVAGETLPLQVQIGTCGGNFGNSTAVFIDFNQDGDFLDAGERAYVSTASVSGPHVEAGNITIPGNAVVGITGMRVINVETTNPNSIAPCATYTWGETEDYLVNIAPCVPLTLVTPPASKSAVCGSATFLSTVITGTGRVYQWQVQTAPGGAWTNLANTGAYTGANADTLRINPVATSMNGYNYRVVYSGGCTSTTFTPSATLTVTPIVANVTPTSAAFCLGGSQKLTINNIASPSAASQTFSSGVLAIPIPDGVVAGINHTIPISGIPAGATVTNITVTVNVPHTYVADLMLVVRGPSNAILNLSNLIGGANAPGVNFTNTAFSSLATAPLNSGTSPGYTGTFRADGAGAVGAFGVPGGPTGFTPTLPGGNLSAFHAQPNGNWTIAMYDAGPPDVGTLIGWSVKVDYVIGSPATGVFTGPTGTIFTDAATTVPYTGTPINAVFVKPTAIGVNNYTVVVTDAACSSNPLTIPVTVNAPVGGTATLTNRTICEGSNTTFTLGGALSGPSTFIHQYQVSTNGGTTFTNITNGGVYSGATTSSLTLTNVPNSFNGYRFRDSISAAGACGSLISSVAILTVNPKPVVTISVAPVRNLFPGLTTTLTAAVSPNPTGAAYQWFRDGAAVAGATTNTLGVNIDQLGTYTIRVTDLNGCVAAAGTSTPASITIGDSANFTRLFIYPSPNNGRFQVRYFNDITNGGITPGVINVYDAKGARVFSRNYKIGGGYQSMNVDLGTSHGKGIYRVDLLTNTGERIKTGSVFVF